MSALYTHNETRNGFNITAQAFEEDHSVAEAGFDDCEEYQRQVDAGELEYFRVEFTVSLNGHLLGSKRLGGCLYEDFDDFLTTSGYYEYIIEEAIEDARASLAELCAASKTLAAA
jgi:hypothetical protein